MSNSQNDRYHYWAFGGFLEEEAAELVGHLRFDKVEVDGVHAAGGLLDGVFDDEARLAKQILRFAQINKAA